jgi:hypothetical protein
VRATDAFVRELLSLAAERSAAILALTRGATAAVAGWSPASAPAVPIRARLTPTPGVGEVVFERLEPTTDTTDTPGREPGVRRGMRRTGQYRTERMPIVDRFVPSVVRPAPYGYAVAATDTGALRLLRAHGVALQRLTRDWTGDAGPQWVTDSATIAPRPFQGRRESTLHGRWVPGPPLTLAAGTVIVPVAQPLGVVAMYLLEPESDDGVVNWDVGGRSSAPGTVPAIVRLAAPLRVPLERAP